MKKNYCCINGGGVLYYLKMNFNRPTKKCLYDKMLNFVKDSNEKLFAPTRKEVLIGVGMNLDRGQKKLPNWEIVQALLECDYIRNVGKKNCHKYQITEAGKKLLASAK